MKVIHTYPRGFVYSRAQGFARVRLPSPSPLWLALLVLCMLATGSACAEQWRSLLLEPGVEYFTNPATRVRNGRYAAIEVLTNFQKAKRYRNRPYLSTIETWSVDCAENKLSQIEIRAMSDAMGSGALVFQEKTETAWFAAKPGTVSQDLAAAACTDR